MKLVIDDTEHDLLPIKTFREQHNLLGTFGIAQFEPKNYEGLGRLDKAGSDMNDLRDHVLQLIPDSITIQELMGFIDHIQFQFQTDLFNINEAISLKDVEVEFAVAGFGDVLRSMIYKMIPAKASKQEMPAFEGIYYGWINDSVRVSSQIHKYPHHSEIWHIQVINHVYGRAGLKVQRSDEVVYIEDGHYLCPAEGFMYALLKDVTHKIWNAIR